MAATPLFFAENPHRVQPGGSYGRNEGCRGSHYQNHSHDTAERRRVVAETPYSIPERRRVMAPARRRPAIHPSAATSSPCAVSAERFASAPRPGPGEGQPPVS